MNRILNYCAGLVLSAPFCFPVMAGEAAYLELGKGVRSQMVRVALQWHWDRKWFEDGDWFVTGSWDFSLASWRGNVSTDGDVADIGVTPVFRVQRNQATQSGTLPYLELGVGAHYLFGNKINVRDLSTRFQFGDHIGFGMRLGAGQRWDLSYRFQHLSNGNIKTPNVGLNVNILRLGYHFN